MLTLNAAQVQALQAIRRERQLALLGRALAAGFPEISGRLGERYRLLIDLGVQRGTAHGLSHVLCLARYLACWCVLGAEFEGKPGFAWAATILTAPGRNQGVKVFQLCRRTREELTRLAQSVPPPPGLMPVASFDAAIAELDAALREAGDLGALLPGEPPQLGQACDIDAIELRVIEPAAALVYRSVHGQWQRAAIGAERAPLLLKAGSAAPDGTSGDAAEAAPGLPPRLSVLAPGRAGDAAQLRIRTLAAHCCDREQHPLVTLAGPQGRSEWRGMPSANIVTPLFAPIAAAAPADALLPLIGAESPAEYSLLAFSACGMRDDGPPIGSPSTHIAVQSAEQHLMAWQRSALPVQAWPGGTAVAAGSSRVRIERDGVLLDATRWQAGLDELDRRLLQGLSRLATAWERESGVGQGRLEAEPRLLCGQAAVTWGWAESAQGLRGSPFFRIAGHFDLLACQLDLRFSGVLALAGSSSRLQLECRSEQPLKLSFERHESDPDIATALAGAQMQFRLPFVLSLQPLADAGLALVDAASPVRGALVGSCGLRPRPDGLGLQWVATLAVEATSVVLHWHDPLLGQQQLLRPLLPEMKLLDWSLG